MSVHYQDTDPASSQDIKLKITNLETGEPGGYVSNQEHDPASEPDYETLRQHGLAESHRADDNAARWEALEEAERNCTDKCADPACPSHGNPDDLVYEDADV